MLKKRSFVFLLVIILIVSQASMGCSNVTAENVNFETQAEDMTGSVTHSYPILSTDVSTQAKELLQKLILLHRKSSADAISVQNGTAYGVPIYIPFDWSCSSISSRSTAYAIHGFVFLDDTYYQYKQTGNTEYRDLIIAYILDWVKQNPTVMEDNEWAWHDDATARRMHRLCVYYDEFFDCFCEEERRIVEESLYEQAILLMDQDFYKELHNHGFFQDVGLAAYALLICKDVRERENMLSLALHRTGEYLDYVYTLDGVHKEHSVYYARDVSLLSRLFGEIVADNSPQFTEYVREITKNNISYLMHVIQPDGTAPSVGVSATANGFINDSVFDGDDEAEYVRSCGQHGIRPSNSKVFESGYFFARSSWDDEADDATWMMFLAATFSSAHKHGDDLSFLLYHKGELFVEAGKRDYNYSDLQTGWAYSTYAHNGLLVNGESFPVKVNANGFQSIYPSALETKITDYEIRDDYQSVSGICKRYDNVTWNRTLEYNKTEDLVYVSDELIATEELDAELLFHIAEGVTVTQLENGLALARDGEVVAEMTIDTDLPINLRTYTQENMEYPYCPWIFNGRADPTYGTLLVVSAQCSEGSNKLNAEIHLK